MPRPISPERAAQIRQLFEEFSELPEADRTEFLDQACRDDVSLRHELTALLRHAESGELRFDDFARDVVTPMLVALGEDPEGLYTLLEDADATKTSVGDRRVGRRVSHFDIIERIGEGGMGVVYKARDRDLQRTVAIKFLPRALTADVEAKERFIIEARAASALDHPHIATIYETGETAEDGLFIAMAYYEGETLKGTIQRGPLPIDRAMKITAQLVEGLAEAHSKGVVHRDVKSGNVMICSDGSIRLLDFGLAKQVHTATLTRTGTTLGTAAYMSPEQARGESVDHRTDLWSLGAVLYEMLTGEKPFQGENAYAIIYSILHEDPKAITDLRPEVDPALADIVERCLEKDSEQRYQSASDLLADLDEAIATSEIPSPATRGRSGPTRRRSRRPSGKRRKVPIALLIILVVVAGIGTWILKRPAPEPKPEPLALAQPKVEEPPPAPIEREKSIAVLPFVHLSNREENVHNTAGIHGQVISVLSRIRDIKVINRNSTMAYRETTKNMRTIGQELGVATLLTGTVEWADDRIYINVQLIDAATDEYLWGEDYNRDLTTAHIFDIRGGICNAIARELKAELSPQENESIAKNPTENWDALEAYFKGMEIYERKVKLRMPKAIEHFQRAIDLDPNFTLAYVGLAWSYFLPASSKLVSSMPREEALERAKAAAAKALELDDSLAEVHTLWSRFNPEGPVPSYKRALELNPNYAEAYYWYAMTIEDVDPRDKELKRVVLARLQKAVELEPTNGDYRRRLHVTLSQLGRFDEARKELEWSTRFNPSYALGYRDLGKFWFFVYGRYDEAMVWFRKAVALDPSHLRSYYGVQLSYDRLGDWAEAARWAEITLATKPRYYFSWKEDLHRYRGEEGEAVEGYRKLLQQHPDHHREFLWRYVLNSDLRAGRYQEARIRYEGRYPILFENDPVIDRFWRAQAAMELAAVLTATEEKDQANRLMDRAWDYYRLVPRMGDVYRVGYGIRDAIMYALKGEKRRALDSLREAIDDGFRDRLELDAFELDPLRNEPEFIAMIKEIDEDLAKQLANVRRMEANGELAAIPDLKRLLENDVPPEGAGEDATDDDTETGGTKSLESTRL